MPSKKALATESGSVGVAQRDEMSMLGEPINHDQYDALAMDAREAFDEIKRDVRPDLGRHIEGLEQTYGLEGLCLGALTSEVGAHELTH